MTATSITERIIGAICAALQSRGGPSGLTVDRERRRAIDAAQLPNISVYPTTEQATRPHGSRTSPAVQRVLGIDVRLRAAGDSSATDPLRLWAVQQIMADPSLGGLALDVEEGSTEWETEEGTEGKIEAAICTFQVTYVTARASLAASS